MTDNREFSTNEMINMILIIEKTQCRKKTAKRIYQERFPHCRQPSGDASNKQEVWIILIDY